MAKQKTEQQLGFAPEIKPFLDGDYFRGLCEIAAASKQGVELYVPDASYGLFQSLYYKRVYGREEIKEKGCFKILQFAMKNRFLYDYDRETRTYGNVKPANYDKFVETVKHILATNDYKLFSLSPVYAETLDEVLG